MAQLFCNEAAGFIVVFSLRWGVLGFRWPVGRRAGKAGQLLKARLAVVCRPMLSLNKLQFN